MFLTVSVSSGICLKANSLKLFFFVCKRGRVWFSYYLVGILQLQTILFCSRSIDIFLFCISMSQLVQLLYTMYFQTDICLQKHVVNGSRMGGFPRSTIKLIGLILVTFQKRTRNNKAVKCPPLWFQIQNWLEFAIIHIKY